MAEYTEKILLSVGIENTEAAKRLVEIHDSLEQVKKAKKEATSTEEIVKYSAEIRALSQEQRALQKTVDVTAKANRAQEGSIEQLRAKLVLLNDEYNRMLGEQRENTEAGQKLKAETKQLSDTIKELESAVGDNRRNVGNYGETIAGLEARLIELNQTIKTLPLGSDEMKNAADEASKLRLQIDQALGKVDEFGNREPKNPVKKGFEDATEAAGALTSTIALLSVAYADSENLQELQAKSLQAMAVAQNVANIVKAKGAIIDTARLVKEKALVAVQQAYTLAVGQSTGALKVFRIAVASTGVGALVIVLAQLILNFDETAKRARQLTTGIHDLALAISGGNETFAKAIEWWYKAVTPLFQIIKAVELLRDAFGPEFKVDVDALSKTYDKFGVQLEQTLEPMRRQIALRKAQGATEKEIAELTAQMLAKETEERQKAYDRAIQIQAEFVKRGQVFSDEQKKLFDQVVKDYSDSATNQTLFAAEQETKRREIAKKATQERIARLKEEAAARMELERALREQTEDADIEAIQNETERQTKRLELDAQRQKDALTQQLNDLKGTDAEKAAAAALTAQRILQIDQKLAGDRQKLQKASADAIRQQQYTSEIAAINQQLELDELRADNEISDAKEREGRKLEIRAQALAAQLELTKQFLGADGLITEEEQRQLDILAEKIIGIKKQIEDAKAAGDDGKNIFGLSDGEVQALQGSLDIVSKGLSTLQQAFDQGYKERLDAIESQKNAEISAVKDSALSEEEKDKKIAEIEKNAAMRKYEQDLEAFNVSKGIQIANAVIQTAQAVIAAFSSGAAIPIAGVGIGPAFAAAAGILGAAQIGIIAAQQPPPPPQFFDGGFTEQSGNPYRQSKYSNSRRGLHHNEYVTPYKVLRRPEAMPHVAALESMRLGTPGYMNLPGYANGGFTDASYAATVVSRGAEALTADQIAEATAVALRDIKVVTKVTDIQKVGGDVIYNEVTSAI